MMRRKVTWISRERDSTDKRGDSCYETLLRQFIQATLKEDRESLMRRVKKLERVTLLSHFHPSTRQQARFFYHAGLVYQQFNQLACAHEAFTLCQERLCARDVGELFQLHSCWAPIIDALGYTLYAYRSYTVCVELADQQRLPHTPYYRHAQCRRQALFALLTQ